MPTFADDEDDDEPDYFESDSRRKELDNIVIKSLGLPKDFQTENPEKDKRSENETKYLRDLRTSPWDKLLGKTIINNIARLNLELQTPCTYLKKAQGSESYYYCQSEAIKQVSNKTKKFTGVVANSDSAELAAHVPFIELRDYCTSNCDLCKEYKNNNTNT